MTGHESPGCISGTYLRGVQLRVHLPDGRGRAGRRARPLGLRGRTGALSWAVESGHAGGVNLSGLGAVIACRYDDDEPGSPWTFLLYVDERGDDAQREALVGILTGARGGTPLEHFPRAWKESHLLGWRAVGVEIDHTPGRGWFRAGGRVEVRIRGPVAGQAPVTCVIPGHGRAGTEDVRRPPPGETSGRSPST